MNIIQCYDIDNFFINYNVFYVFFGVYIWKLE